MHAGRSCARWRDVGRYDADGGQVPTTLFEAAAFHRTIKARCSCGREAVFHAAALWWLFQQRRWPAHLDYVPDRLRCTGCGRRGISIVAGRDAPTVTSLPMPDGREWKRAVSRFRS